MRQRSPMLAVACAAAVCGYFMLDGLFPVRA